MTDVTPPGFLLGLSPAAAIEDDTLEHAIRDAQLCKDAGAQRIRAGVMFSRWLTAGKPDGATAAIGAAGWLQADNTVRACIAIGLPTCLICNNDSRPHGLGDWNSTTTDYRAWVKQVGRRYAQYGKPNVDGTLPPAGHGVIPAGIVQKLELGNEVNHSKNALFPDPQIVAKVQIDCYKDLKKYAKNADGSGHQYGVLVGGCGGIKSSFVRPLNGKLGVALPSGAPATQITLATATVSDITDGTEVLILDGAFQCVATVHTEDGLPLPEHATVIPTASFTPTHTFPTGSNVLPDGNDIDAYVFYVGSAFALTVRLKAKVAAATLMVDRVPTDMVAGTPLTIGNTDAVVLSADAAADTQMISVTKPDGSAYVPSRAFAVGAIVDLSTPIRGFFHSVVGYDGITYPQGAREAFDHVSYHAYTYPYLLSVDGAFSLDAAGRMVATSPYHVGGWQLIRTRQMLLDTVPDDNALTAAVPINATIHSIGLKAPLLSWQYKGTQFQIVKGKRSATVTLARDHDAGETILYIDAIALPSAFPIGSKVLSTHNAGSIYITEIGCPFPFIQTNAAGETVWWVDDGRAIEGQPDAPTPGQAPWYNLEWYTAAGGDDAHGAPPARGQAIPTLYSIDWLDDFVSWLTDLGWIGEVYLFTYLDKDSVSTLEDGDLYAHQNRMGILTDRIDGHTPGPKAIWQQFHDYAAASS